MRAARDAATVEVVSHPAPARVATIADLLAIPEAERRHEIIDGALVAKEAASGRHGVAQVRAHLAGGAVVTGAVIGAAGGAAVGALTGDSKH